MIAQPTTRCIDCGELTNDSSERCKTCLAIIGLAQNTKPEVCPRCDARPVPKNFITCLGCAVSLDVDALAKARDELGQWINDRAAWLDEAQAVLEMLPADDPQRAKGIEIWQWKLTEMERTSRNHAALCWMVPA